MNCFRKSFCIAFAILIAFLFTGCSESSETVRTGVLVSTDWLQDHLNDPDLVVLHSGTAELFDSLHIPGARLILPHAFTMEIDGVRNQMPPADSIVDLLRDVGVNNDSKIVLYHEDIGLLNRTARVFMTLDHLGLGQQTMVLSGGLSAWIEEAYELSDEQADFSPGNIELTDVKEIFVTATELDKQRWNNQVVVIDARSDEEYFGTAGTTESPAEGGHIEGAYLLSYLTLTYDDSPYLFKSDKELEELFRIAGMESEKISIIYCNSGIKGSLNYLIARHLSYPVLFYDGSFEEWQELELPFTGPLALPDTTE